eukprot:TRINITY_DN5249_c0_g2_i1.p1 TRINITY_DN5249_c0_g2~~TRINITY_DN5249_c0_g2_i1.p1  ORF type:complete len:179 (+),score=34.13 TRINITY_DN5249_c0_g2_i1:64-600(+)
MCIRDRIYFPIQMILGIYLMFAQIQLKFLVGLTVIIIITIISGKILQIRFEYETAEVLSGIRLIKMNAWEEFFAKRLKDKRNKEVNQLAKVYWCWVAFITVFWMTPPAVTNSVFANIIFTDGKLRAEEAFVITVTFQILGQAIMNLPKNFSFVLDTGIAISRLQKFLLSERSNCCQEW